MLEVVEVDVLEDDAIFDLRPEGPSHKHGGLSLSLMHRLTSAACRTIFDLLTVGLSTDLNIFQKQYKNKIQTELSRAMMVFFFNA